MANKKKSALTSATGYNASDVVAIARSGADFKVDLTSAKMTMTGKTFTGITINTSLGGSAFESNLSSSAATSKAPLASAAKSYSDSAVSTHSSAATGVHGLSGTANEVVGAAATQTLLNKTLTSPVVNTGVSGSALETDLSVTAATSKVPTAAAAKAYADSVAGGGFYDAYVMASETQTSGSGPGASPAAGWNVRVLNTEDTDTASIATLASNRVTVPAGTYYVRGSAPGYRTALGKVAIYNVTATAYVLVGHAQYSDTTNLVENLFQVEGQIALSATANALELRHYSSSGAGNFGNQSSSGQIERYAVLELWRRT